MHILVFDGGRNNTRGCYGSWCILQWVTCDHVPTCKRKRKRCPVDVRQFTLYTPCPESKRRLVERYTFDLPDLRTCNQSEWASLCRGLLALVEQGVDGDVVIVGDSRLVLNQFTGRWACWAEHLQPLYREALGLSERLKAQNCAIFCEWRPRHAIAAYLGH